ncbi:bacteriocin immunity protein [Winslowiella sp. 2C04]|uniref:bacteriocin immunity protein n=1 Tax=Winslowiella sp. 2C04 TaxID=3416179 RepID=UPI003CF11601
MTEKKKLTDYTENEFLDFVSKLFDIDNTTEAEDIKNILAFKRLTEHPDGSNLIYYPSEDSPEGVVQEVKEWLQANGKQGFKE